MNERSDADRKLEDAIAEWMRDSYPENVPGDFVLVAVNHSPDGGHRYLNYFPEAPAHVLAGLMEVGKNMLESEMWGEEEES